MASKFNLKDDWGSHFSSLKWDLLLRTTTFLGCFFGFEEVVLEIFEEEEEDGEEFSEVSCTHTPVTMWN